MFFVFERKKKQITLFQYNLTNVRRDKENAKKTKLYFYRDNDEDGEVLRKKTLFYLKEEIRDVSWIIFYLHLTCDISSLHPPLPVGVK